jgi:hypothetical protein
MQQKLTLCSKYLSLSLFALVIELLADRVAGAANLRYYDSHSTCSQPPPTSLNIMLVAVAGVAIALLGTIICFKSGHRWLGVIAILLLMLTAVGAFLAYQPVTFTFCF